MARELAFVLINPYTIRKSRTGGVIGRYFRRENLQLVAVRMFAPSLDLVEQFSDLIRADEHVEQPERDLLADYVERAYQPDPESGRRKRVLMLLFEGENAIEEIRQVTGKLRHNLDSGRTVRDIYGDFIVDEDERPVYMEPAVITGGGHADSVGAALRLWGRFSEQDGGLVDRAEDVTGHEQTLVLIKPDNFYFASARPGSIVDTFSASGLRIVGAKLHRISVSQALEFYGPVQEVLRGKFRDYVGDVAMATLSDKLEFDLPEAARDPLIDLLAPLYGDRKFHEIIHFMTGLWPEEVPEEDRDASGKVKTLALVYQGEHAVDLIRGILGTTDPSKAQPGSVRREFGRNVMVNAAHASDSPDNARREMGIIGMQEDTLSGWIDKYYG